MSTGNKLLTAFTTFMLEHGIECVEDIYQNDTVGEDSLELIEDLFNIIDIQIKCDNKQTNADRIRNMSDEEIAEWINTKNMCEQCANYYEPDSECMGEPCASNILRWLQSEAE